VILKIHGDNVVECERTLALIQEGLGGSLVRTDGPSGSVACPEFLLELNRPPGQISVVFHPGFGRWNQDVLAHIRNKGGRLREAADVVISRLENGYEEVLVALEYCGALPAGNQAWQRSGRAYSLSLAGVPYLYVAEVGGFELDSQRQRRAPRLPNPAVPFSYFSQSVRADVPTIPVFVRNLGCGQEILRSFGGILSERELPLLLSSLALGDDWRTLRDSIQGRVLEFVRLLAARGRRGNSIDPEQWSRVAELVGNDSRLVRYLASSVEQAWSKTAYISDLTLTAKALMKLASELGVGLTSSKLPFCVIPAERRREFASKVTELYGSLPEEFGSWLAREDDLCVAWIMGFKPRGDDARPDRGLPPFLRMLVGDQVDVLSVVYGPAPTETWPLLVNSPRDLGARNGLWEAILETSDALLVDSATDLGVTQRGYLQEHWQEVQGGAAVSDLLVSNVPERVGENDVDTALHTFLFHVAGSAVFEGMCNPPGGDWSGLSLQTPSRDRELRWLSLPRVSGSHTKRPDHVFQLFLPEQRPVILAVESKERAASLERGVGGRLVRYVADLMNSPASVERRRGDAEWVRSERRLSRADYQFVSAVAFLSLGDPPPIFVPLLMLVQCS
jgi:hypothetical protein